MIEKIDIPNFGSFTDYEWRRSVGNDVQSFFKPMNIIYGRNYAGKTTLSRILRCLEIQELHKDFDLPQFNIQLQNGNVINQENIWEASNFKTRVYNTDFVKANLSWFNNEEGEIKSFAILGEKNVEIEKKIDALVQRLGSIDEKKGLLYEEFSLNEKMKSEVEELNYNRNELESTLRRKAQDIKNTGDVYNVPTYNINMIKRDIQELSMSDKLNDDEIEVKGRLLREDARKLIPKLKPLNDNFQTTAEISNDLIRKKITPSEPIIDLINNSILQNWVRDGIKQHKGVRENCGFCGKVIDDDLWKRLDKHFNQESEILRNEIDLCIKKLNNLENGISEYFKPELNDFYVDIQSEYTKVLGNFEIVRQDFINCISSLVKKLRERANDIFNERETISYINLTDSLNSEIEKINDLIDENNQKTINLSQRQNQARIELRKSEIVKFVEVINYTKKKEKIAKVEERITDLNPHHSAKSAEVIKVKKEITELEEQLQDESRGASMVNNHLSSFFGHDALMLVSEGKKPNISFKILRDGIEAKNLSEGECSLIAFCYFIAQLEDQLQAESGKDELIIYIDDPISSLDGNHIYFMFSLIESVIAKRRNYLQLFISTHNMDFLKYIKRLTTPNGKKEDVNHFLIERRMKKNISGSFLVKMPDHIRDYVTEFNYLFNELYSVYKEVKGERKRMLENTYNNFYNLPNNIRKFLECYLFYKYPNNKSPLDNLDKLFDDGNTPVLVNRVINEYSHLVYIDRGWKPIDVEEMEKCVCIIMEKIKEKDSEQFNALLESIGQKENNLELILN